MKRGRGKGGGGGGGGKIEKGVKIESVLMSRIQKGKNSNESVACFDSQAETK